MEGNWLVTLSAYLGPSFRAAILELSWCANGWATSTYFEQSWTTGSRGWSCSIWLMWFCHRSISETRCSSPSILPALIIFLRTRSDQSSQCRLVLSCTASGGMYTSVPGHIVKVTLVAWRFLSLRVAIPKSVTLAMALPINSTLLPEKSLCTSYFVGMKERQSSSDIITDIHLNMVWNRLWGAF